jgi:hypothetical protein
MRDSHPICWSVEQNEKLRKEEITLSAWVSLGWDTCILHSSCWNLWHLLSWFSGVWLWLYLYPSWSYVPSRLSEDIRHLSLYDHVSQFLIVNLLISLFIYLSPIIFIIYLIFIYLSLSSLKLHHHLYYLSCLSSICLYHLSINHLSSFSTI